MTHSFAVCIPTVKPGLTLAAQVALTLAPFDANLEVDDIPCDACSPTTSGSVCGRCLNYGTFRGNTRSVWNWYTVGGRYDGCIRNRRAYGEQLAQDSNAVYRDEHNLLPPNTTQAGIYGKLLTQRVVLLEPYSIFGPEGLYLSKEHRVGKELRQLSNNGWHKLVLLCLGILPAETPLVGVDYHS